MHTTFLTVQIFFVLNILLQYKFAISHYLSSEANLLEVLSLYIQERDHYIGNATKYLNAIEKSISFTGSYAYSDNDLKNKLYRYLILKRLTLDWKNFLQVLNNDTFFVEEVKKSIFVQNTGKFADWVMESNDIKLMHFVRELIKIQKKLPSKNWNGNPEDLRKLKSQLRTRINIKMKKFKTSLQEFITVTNAAFYGPYPYWETYKRLCRGEILHNNNLKCRYVHNNKPYLLIGPLKQEELHSVPRVFMYHEVLFDSEIEEIMWKSTEQKMTISQGTENTYRVSKVTWMPEGSFPKIHQRLEDMTNLNMNSAERLQVSTYGIAGHYHPHYDNSLDASSPTYARMATILIYMNDVTKGGATAFPELKIAAWPRKGSAVFWYNIKPNFSVDIRTLHAGCPLYYGTKWVVNSWVSRHKQELRIPCVADLQDYFV